MCSAAIVIISIIPSTLWQEYPTWMWYLLAPVGVFAAGATAIISAAGADATPTPLGVADSWSRARRQCSGYR